MTNRAFLSLLLGGILLMGGQVSSPLQRPDIRRDLDLLLQRGFTCRMPNNNVIELTDPLSGEKYTKSLREPSEAEIRAWAAQRGIPILEIDPTKVDTTKYSGWFKYWTQVPLANSLGIPLVIGDVDRDISPDVYGTFKDFTTPDFEAHVHEIHSNACVRFEFNYVPRPGVSRGIVNIDQDSLHEVFFSFGGGLHFFEQSAVDSLPTTYRLMHERHQGKVDPGYTGVFVGSLDVDSLADILYKGSESDSANPNGITRVYVAEYNPDSANFIRVWSSDYGLNGNVSGVGGFAVDDFDGDGKKEFVISEQWSGQVIVTESVGNDAYQETWRDTVPFSNLYYLTSGDADGDGKPEFFVGATTSNGNWTLVYEADSNNSYSLQFLFHLLAGGGSRFSDVLYNGCERRCKG